MDQIFLRRIPATLAGIALLAAPSWSTSAFASASMSAPAQAPGRAGARVVTDEAGRRVTIPAEVRRIVSLAPSVTEMIYALKLDDRLVGDTDYCDVPAAAKTKPHVGSVLNPSLESIAGLRPDVVFAVARSGNRKETVEALDQIGIPVYVIDPGTVQAMVESIVHIAKVAGAEQRGADLAAELRTRLDNLHARLADLPMVHVLFAVWLDPLTTIGQNTFIADALRWAGAESIIETQQDWPKLSMEEVVRLQPDYIVLAESHTGEGSRSVEDLRTRPAWRDLRAVELGHIAIVSEEIDRPAPGLIDAIEQLAHELHPDAYETKSGVIPPDGASEVAQNAESSGARSCLCAR